MQYKQITLGLQSKQAISKFIAWATKHVNRNRAETGQNWLSFDIEHLSLKKEALDLYTKRQELFRAGKDVEDVRTYRMRVGEKGGVPVPCTIIFGDGISWMGSVKFPFEPVTESGKEVIDDESLQPAMDLMLINLNATDPIFQFFQDFSALCGSGVHEDIEKLTIFLSNVYKVNVLFPRQIELQTLFAAAGGKFAKTGLETLSYIILGGIQNKLVSTADNGWFIPFDKMCGEFILYCVADVRVGFCLGVVLFTTLIRQNFPDSDAPCFALNLKSQAKLVCYLTDVFIYALNGTKIKSPETLPQCQSRAAIFRTLRPEYLSDSNQNKKIDLIAKICAVPTPTLIHGGGRIIHQSRYDFVCRQYPFLQELGTPGKPDVVFNLHLLKPKLKYESMSYLLLGRDLSHHQQVVLPPVFDARMLPSPLYLGRVTKFVRAVMEDPSTLLRPSLSYHADKSNLTLSQLILEACCCEPDLVSVIARWISQQDLNSKDVNWWVSKAYIYEKVRFMFQYVKGYEADDAANLRKVLQARKDRAMSNELGAYQDQAREARMLLGMQSFMSGNDNDVNSLNLHERLYAAVPGKNTARNFHTKQELKRLKHENLQQYKVFRDRLRRKCAQNKTQKSRSVFDRLGTSKKSGSFFKNDLF